MNAHTGRQQRRSVDAVSPRLAMERFAETVGRQPDAIAVSVAESDGTARQEMSYAGLAGLVTTVAAQLRAAGIGAETLVGVAVARDVETVAALLAVWTVGAAFVPLDASLPAARRQQLVAESGLVAIVVPQARAEAWAAEAPQLLTLAAPGARPRRARQTAPLTAAQAAYVIYTSGSTGAPKGVVVTHGGLANHTAGFAAVVGLTAADNVLQFASLAFDAAYEEIVPCLSVGARLVLPPASVTSDSRALVTVCAAQKVTLLDVPTSFWHVLTRLMRHDGLALPAPLRWLVIGGEEASAARLADWHAARPAARLLNTYGPTEATIITTAVPLDTVPGDGVVPLGACLPNTWVVLGDAAAPLPAPPGEVAELGIGGAGVARGYWGDPRLTAARFVPATAGGRVYRTGDLALQTAAGTLLFKGRVDYQVKLHGYRIQLEEVEQALQGHPAVAACVVLVRDDRHGGQHLIAYCVLAEAPGARPFAASPPSVTALRQFVQERLPAYMLPAEFVFLEKFLRTPNGKIDRATLPQVGHFDRKRRRLPDYQHARGEIETTLAAIWGEVLDLDPAELSVEDPFEYLGGNSLFTIQVRYKAQEAGLVFKAADLHLRQTIRGLAACCQKDDGPLTRLKHTVDDYANYVQALCGTIARDAAHAIAWRRRATERRVRHQVARFYDGLANSDEVIYVYFTRHLLHWLNQTLSLAGPYNNIVLIGARLDADEVAWVRTHLDYPFLHLDDDVDLDMIWDVLFDINRKNFGWLDVDCFVMNPSLFEQMRRIAPDEAINCLWTHAACGPTKRPFHVVETYYLYFNVAVIDAMRRARLLPRPSARTATLRQVRTLKNLIPGDEQRRAHFRTMGGSAFTHRMFDFDFGPLILYQLVANASGYKLNRVRFYTELDTFNPYNYYSDEAIHVFPSIRNFDRFKSSTIDLQRLLAADYLLLVSIVDRLPPLYAERKAFLEGRLATVNLSIAQLKGLLRRYLMERYVTARTFERPEFQWMADGHSDEPAPVAPKAYAAASA